MERDERPDPEELLRAIQREEQAQKKGQLKIFLGMAAGVGKTYSMLGDAQRLTQDGVDVIVGIVDTHGRPETADLLKGLFIIPPKIIQYKGTEFQELDLDQVIKRQPQVVLVDELAHSNVPGSRHLKRWQDVVELLEHGIDVITTLNVQHIESLKDAVETIVSVQIRETVPDVVIEQATFIQVVDLTPDALLQRLKEGKVYFGKQSEIAARHFFQKNQMAALRELVLRYSAQKVDHDLRRVTAASGQPRKWKTRERLLVHVTPSPFSQALIRTARSLAYNFKAAWLAVVVDDGTVLNETDKAMLAKNLSLAHELGAEVVTVTDPDIVKGIQSVVLRQGITQIIVEKTPQKYILGLFLKTSFVGRLVQACPDIDIHIVRAEATWEPLTLPTLYRKWMSLLFSKLLHAYFFALCFAGATLGLGWLLLPYVGYKIIGLVFLGAILVLSLFTSLGPLLFGAILFAVGWVYFFIQNTKLQNDDIVVLVLYFLAAFVAGALNEKMREAVEVFARREEFAHTLFNVLRFMGSNLSFQEVVRAISDHLGSALNGKCDILIKKIDNGLPFENPPPFLMNEKEAQTAQWAFENDKEAGWSTSTLSAARALYVPLRGTEETVGVLGYHPITEKILSPDEKNLLYTVVKQLSAYVERTFGEERKRRAELGVVLKSISRGMQKNLASIEMSAKTLSLNAGIAAPQVHTIESASEDLLRMLMNISAYVKIIGGTSQLNLRPHNIKELIDSCVEKAKKYLSKHKLAQNIQEDLPLISFDLSLIETVVISLLLNAAGFSPVGSKIILDVKQEKNSIAISIADEGEGIPAPVLKSLLDGDLSVSPKPIRIGLGLTLSKRIAEMHHGQLLAENLPSQGARVSLVLPL